MSLRSSLSRSFTFVCAVFSLSDQSRINLSAFTGVSCTSDTRTTGTSGSETTVLLSAFASFTLMSASSFVSLSFSLVSFLFETSVSLNLLPAFSTSPSKSSTCSCNIFNFVSFLASSFLSVCKFLSTTSRL